MCEDDACRKTPGKISGDLSNDDYDMTELPENLRACCTSTDLSAVLYFELSTVDVF